jgi:hypothetical protein
MHGSSNYFLQTLISDRQLGQKLMDIGIFVIPIILVALKKFSWPGVENKDNKIMLLTNHYYSPKKSITRRKTQLLKGLFTLQNLRCLL